MMVPTMAVTTMVVMMVTAATTMVMTGLMMTVGDLSCQRLPSRYRTFGRDDFATG
jgi:hypothetical protein